MWGLELITQSENWIKADGSRRIEISVEDGECLIELHQAGDVLYSSSDLDFKTALKKALDQIPKGGA
jgi:hypothetical protein